MGYETTQLCTRAHGRGARTDEERARLEAGVRSSEGLVVRRCQMVLASARGEQVPRIARAVGCDPKTVRDVVQGFNAAGVAILQRGSRRPHAPHMVWTPQAPTALPALLHRSPRDVGHPTSVWTLALVAAVSGAQGLSARVVSPEAVRQLRRRLGIRWKRAKHGSTSPDPAYRPQSRGATA
jgi:transposase